MDASTPLDQDNQLLYTFLNRKKTRDNQAAMTAQRLVNLFRQLDVFKPEFVHEYNQMLLSTTDEIQMMLQDIVGGPTVRQYLTYLQQSLGQVSNEEIGNTENQTVSSVNTGYLPSADEDTPYYKTVFGVNETVSQKPTESIVTIQDFTKWQESQEALIYKAMMAQNEAISKLASVLSEKMSKTSDVETRVIQTPQSSLSTAEQPTSSFVHQAENDVSVQSDSRLDTDTSNQVSSDESVINSADLTKESFTVNQTAPTEQMNSFNPITSDTAFETHASPEEIFEEPMASEMSTAFVEPIESFDAPSFDAPNEPIESFDAPSLDAPSEPIEFFDAPSFNAPSEPIESFDAPSFDAPSEPIESFDAPSLDAPSEPIESFDAPSLDAPNEPIESFDAPSFNASSESIESFDAPSFDAPSEPIESFDAPSLDAPNEPIESFDAPSVKTSDISFATPHVDGIISERPFEAPGITAESSVTNLSAPAVKTQPETQQSMQSRSPLPPANSPRATSSMPNPSMSRMGTPAMPSMPSFKNLTTKAPKPSTLGNFFKLPKMPIFNPMASAKPNNQAESHQQKNTNETDYNTSEIDNKGGN